MDYSIYLKKGLLNALLETINDAQEESLGIEAANAKSQFEAYKNLPDNEKELQKDKLRDSYRKIRDFVEYLKREEETPERAEFLLGYTKDLEEIQQYLGKAPQEEITPSEVNDNQNPESTPEEATSEEATLGEQPTEETPAEETPENAQEETATSDDAVVDAEEKEEQNFDECFEKYFENPSEDTAKVLEIIYAQHVDNTSADFNNEYTQAIAEHLQKTEEGNAYLEACKKAKEPTSQPSEEINNVLASAKEKLIAKYNPLFNNSTCPLIARDIFISLNKKAEYMEDPQAAIDDLEAKAGPAIKNAFQNESIVTADPESRFANMSIKEIWTLGFKELAIINTYLDKTKKLAENCGLAPDLIGVLGAIGTVCASIGTIGMLAGKFIPDPITKMIVCGSCRALAGVGTMFKTAPKAIKAFKDGDVKTGLKYTLGAVISGLVISSGIKSVQAGIDWKTAQSFANNLLTPEGREGLIKDIDGKLATETNPDKIDALNNSKLAVQNIDQGLANGTINEDGIREFVSNPTNQGQLVSGINEVVGSSNEAFAMKQAELEALAAQNEIQEANEYAAENGGTYTPQQCADYILRRSGTGANGGWLNSTQYPVDPKLEAAAREYANAHPDIVSSSEQIKNFQMEMNTAQDTINTTKNEIENLVKSDNDVLDGTGFTRGNKELENAIKSAYGGTVRVGGTGFGANSQFTFKDPNGPLMAKQNIFDYMQGKTEGMNPDQLKATEMLIQQGKADIANGTNSSLGNIVGLSQKYATAQQGLANATQSFDAAKIARQAAIDSQTSGLKYLANSPGSVTVQ